jgi:hypothetical protein
LAAREFIGGGSMRAAKPSCEVEALARWDDRYRDGRPRSVVSQQDVTIFSFGCI